MPIFSPLFIGSSKKTNFSFVATIFVCQLLFIPLSIKFGIQILFIFLPIILFLIWRKDLFWGIPIFILLHLLIFKQESGGFSVQEILFGLYLFLFILVWLIDAIIAQKKIIESSLGFWIIALFLFLFLSLVPAYLYHVSKLKWFRELVPFLTLLVIFPIIDLVDSRNKIYIILTSLLLVTIIIGFQNLIDYQKSLTQIRMLWEYGASRQSANEPLFMTSIIVLFSYIILGRYLKTKIAMLPLLLLFTIVLLITFSRGYWLASLIGLTVIFLALPLRKKIILFISTILSLLLLIILLQFLFNKQYLYLISALVERFVSLDKIGTDISTLNRIIESKAVWQLIKANPIIGYGLGKSFYFRTLIPKELPTWYVHNAYLFIWFKIGVFGLLSLVLFMVKAIWDSYLCIKKYENHYLYPLIVSTFALLISMCIVSFSSPQFIQKDSLLIIAIFIGIIEALLKKSSLFIKK